MPGGSPAAERKLCPTDSWRKTKWHWGRGLLLMLPILIAPLWGADQQALEYRVKAAFLLNFTKFIDWPVSDPPATDTPFAICISGDDPFGAVLDQIVEGETVGNRKIVVRRLHGESPRACSLLYVSGNQKDVSQILKGIGPGVLTVGEGDSFLDEGGMIAFIIENRRVRFNIDQAAARKSGLRLSSRLLSVARSVR
jgi:hypothetical protein